MQRPSDHDEIQRETLPLTLFAFARLFYDVFVLDDITDTSLLLFLFALPVCPSHVLPL